MLYALLAYLSWGLVVPVHFRLLAAVPPETILAWRIVFSVVFVAGLLVAMRRRLASPLPLRPRHGLLALSALAIAFNWLIYLEAVNSGHLLDASLGYFINPLVNVALGAALLGERLRPVQAVAVAVAVVGVVVAVVIAGRLPLVSLALAVSFALYGLLRKVVAVDAMIGFTAETVLLLPAALGYLAFSGALAGGAGTPHDAPTFLLLMLTGATTALPLIWFAAAARRLSLATLGLMQYIAPTGLALLGVFLFGESLPPDRLVLFGFVWLALLLYAGDAWRANARRSKSRQAAPGAAAADGKDGRVAVTAAPVAGSERG